MSKLGLIRLCETGLCTLDVLEPQTLVMTFFLPADDIVSDERSVILTETHIIGIISLPQ